MNAPAVPPPLIAHLADVDAGLLARAARVRLACFDVDGTLTDGRLTVGADGVESKSFHVHDGQGLVLLRQAGIEVMFITARRSAAAERRAGELGAGVRTGVADKLACMRELAAERGIGLDAIAFMGDDLPDLTAMRAAGLALAPANAHPWTAAAAHWRTRAKAGKGAAREVCDLLLGARGWTPPALVDGGTA